MNYKNVYYVILVIGGLYILYMMLDKTEQKKENYANDLFDCIKEGNDNDFWALKGMGIKAKDCYSLSGKDCLNYSNCGLCYKDDKAQCIPGDTQGPFFKEDCEQWEHTNYYDRHIFGEKVTTITPPWNKFYSEYEARYPSPQSRATL